ncbi:MULTISPECIES: hypothetical protein [unclassified Novosphingobium]|uniref:hypothetical protein n=1 Tax=unclassified Novosphingobium TaxID=2644732 RepID=UPI001358E2A0|nr:MULTISPECIES: hypothetical protein [unclassified Novosphingobium]
MNALRTLLAQRLLTLRYEDFLVQLKRQIDSFAASIGEEFCDEDWSARCAATVRQPKSSWRKLPDEEARALTEVCSPGFELLREAGQPVTSKILGAATVRSLKFGSVLERKNAPDARAARISGAHPGRLDMQFALT